MKYFSLFSGIGGFELGIQQAYDLQNLSDAKEQQHETAHPIDQQRELDTNRAQRLGYPLCVGYSEIDKYAIQIYERHFPNHKNYGDITTISTETIAPFDLLIGGFPCQSFSIAGKRGGFADTRGTLFFEIARLLKAKQPRLLLLENVKGLLSHDKGATFYTIITTLDELGYDLQWQVLNSKDFGVPQNRERVFIVGHLRGTRRPQVFPITSDGRQTNELPKHISNTLTARYEGAQATGTYIGESELDAQKNGKPDRSSSGQDETIANTNIEPRREKTAPRIRRLTPTECERLQGFPDGWTQGVSDTQRYKCLGNAVTVNVIKEIVSKIIYAETT